MGGFAGSEGRLPCVQNFIGKFRIVNGTRQDQRAYKTRHGGQGFLTLGRVGLSRNCLGKDVKQGTYPLAETLAHRPALSGDIRGQCRWAFDK